ncbi:MAG: TatD family nuclease-associated radical SAM protein [Clostridia bacterium]|nr:TatD family nuclease-associated radical SAM protein [Clostridia bacterium]
MANTYAYEFGNSLYLNLTNRCPNSCEFCLRNFKDTVNGNELWLEEEPTFEDLKAGLAKFDLSKYDSVVFCGFGEPTCNLDMMSKIGPYIKSKGCKIRLNTNGLGNLINGRSDVAKELAAYVDFVSISLNASTAEGYDAICHSQYGKEAFDAMLDFTKDCVREGIDTTMSVVDCIGEEEIAACAKVVEGTGAKFRVRATIDENTEY